MAVLARGLTSVGAAMRQDDRAVRLEPLEPRTLMSATPPIVTWGRAVSQGPAIVMTPAAAGSGQLSPEVTNSTLPSRAVSGVPIKGVVTVKLDNVSSATAKGTVAIYATVSNEVDGAAVLLGSKPVTLKGGRSGKVAVAVKPVALADGEYRILAQTTLADGTTDASITNPVVTVAAAFSSASILIKGVPSSSQPGRAIPFAISIGNGGNVPLSGTATFEYGVSPDGSAAAASDLKTVSRKVNVKPDGRAAVVTLKILIPKSARGTTVYAVVTVRLGDTTRFLPAPVVVGR